MILALAYCLLKKKSQEQDEGDLTEEDFLKARNEKRYVSRRRSSSRKGSPTPRPSIEEA